MIRQPWKRDRRDYTRSAGQHGTHLCLQQDGNPISLSPPQHCEGFSHPPCLSLSPKKRWLVEDWQINVDHLRFSIKNEKNLVRCQSIPQVRLLYYFGRATWNTFVFATRWYPNIPFPPRHCEGFSHPPWLLLSPRKRWVGGRLGD